MRGWKSRERPMARDWARSQAGRSAAWPMPSYRALEIPLVAENHWALRELGEFFSAKGPVADDLVERLAAEIATEHQLALQPAGLGGHDRLVDRPEGSSEPCECAIEREAAFAGWRSEVIMQVKQ